MYPTYASTPPTPMMATVGFGWPDLRDYAQKALAVLPTAGPAALDLIEQGFKMWAAISSRDLTGILSSFAAAQRNVEVIAAAIRAEFGT
jgi:hypothetical protein